jgi:NAD(P)-dependent dehydrogenase (short-subunit alcohol dehydrogenase family)
MNRLAGRVAFVTGGARGIGAGIVDAFMSEGARVVSFDLDGPDEPREGVVELTGSVSSREEIGNAVGDCVRRCGRLDVAVCNAGVLRYAPILELDDATWKAHVDVNLTGVFLTAQVAAHAMADAGRGGSIIITSSTVADVPAKTQGHYSAVKAGAQMLGRAMAWELGEHRIRVNSISPGWVETRFTEDYLAEPASREAVERTIPLGEVSQPSDIAAAAVFLASDESRHVTGANLKVDGGVVIGRDKT